MVSKGLIHAAGRYRAGCVDMRVRAVYTNNPNSGAMRGYGVPQTVFAVERQMDIIARKLGLDPFALRHEEHLPCPATSRPRARCSPTCGWTS